MFLNLPYYLKPGIYKWNQHEMAFDNNSNITTEAFSPTAGLGKTINFLILDEPTNDLDIYTLEILEQFLKDYKGCLVIVSHDRSFMDHIVDHIFVFEGEGKIRDYHSNYTEYLANRNRQQREASLQKREEKPAYVRTKSDKPKATYKQQKEYEQLTVEIETLNKEKAELESILNGGSSDVSRLTEASTRIGEIISALDEKELRWLELDEIVNQ